MPSATIARLASIMARRFSSELRPVSLSSPLVSGTLQVGQTMTADAGSWRNGPTRFAYQWERCDATGKSCNPIIDATAQSYVPSDTDVGATVRVIVTATNGYGSGRAESQASAAILPPSGPPVNVGQPTVIGTPSPGQTLAAMTGTWVNAGVAYFFAWQRCDAAGATWVAIGPTATVQNYVVQPADVGSTLRVAVTATNTFGTTVAVSAPTAVVA